MDTNLRYEGIAERYNRTIVTKARTKITHDKLLHLWAEAIRIAVFLKNIVLHSAILLTPYETLYNRKPKVSYLHTFLRGCFVYVPVEARNIGTKLLDRSE